ncbi:MAG: 4Fe-4S binding protein [Spirochaetes bacterium]|nr:4Fe-4S binding protein [Spirochaetota bacterium]
MDNRTTDNGTIAFALRIRDGATIRELRAEAAPGRTVLDMLEAARSGGAAVPAYRHSCHHGSCGTCGAVVNGLEALMCLTSAADLAAPRPRLPGGPAVPPELDDDGAVVVTLEPLSKMSVVSGLAVSPGPVFAGIPAGVSYLAAVEDGGRAPLPPDPEGARAEGGGGPADDSRWRPAGRARFEACIECGLCVSACPVAVPFIGPAALAAANREREKRPERARAMLDAAARPDGEGPCGRHLACSRVCPQAVYPGKHIQLLRNALGRGSSGGSGSGGSGR